MLKVAEEGLDMAGEVLKKTGVGASALKNVQRTTRRVRRAGSKTGISNKMGQIVLQVADFVGVNFMLGFSGLKLESLENVETRKVVSFSDASSVDGHYDLLNEEDYPEDVDSEDDPEFVPGDEDDHSSSDQEVSDVEEAKEDKDLGKIDEEDDSSEEVVDDAKDLHHDLLNEDYPEDCDSEDDPDFVPGDEEDRSSSDEEGSEGEEMYEDEDSNQDRQEDLHSEERVDVIVPVVVKHEMISPEAVCTDLEKVVEEVMFEEGHCVPMVIKSEPIDEDEVQFEEGHCVPMVIKTDPVEVERTSTNSSYQNLLDYMDNLYAVGSLDVKESIAVADEVENSPAVVTDELGPVSARISALERVVELEKSPKISKGKIAGGSGNCSENIDTDGLCRGMASLEVQESSSTQSNEYEVSESGVVDENEECNNAEGYYKLEVENREAEDRITLDQKDNNINCDVNDAVDVQNDVDGSEADVRDEVEEIIENIIDCATPDCKKVEHVPDTSSDSSSDSELD